MFLTGFGYFGVNYVIEEIQNVLVGNINIDHDLLVVEFAEREEGKLTLNNRIEIHDEKHKLTYTYNVRVEDFVDLNEPRLIIYTDSEQVNIITYSSVILTTTFQAIDVDIELNLNYEFTPGEQLSFVLTFTIENTFPSELNSNEEEEVILIPPDPVVYNMNYEQGSNLTFKDRDIHFNVVQTLSNAVSIGVSESSYLELEINKGDLEIILRPNLGGSNIKFFVLLNGVRHFEEILTDNTTRTINLNFNQDNNIVRLRFENATLSNRLNFEQIIFQPSA